jgi:fructosamine-3-kinase
MKRIPPIIHPVSGGSINQTFRIDTAKRSYFAKINRPVPETFFQKEINGLNAIKQTNTLSVPDVYGTFYEKETQTALLLLEWIEGTETPARPFHNWAEDWPAFIRFADKPSDFMRTI